MKFKETIKLVYQKKWLVFWITVLGAVLFFDLMVIQEPQYKSSSKILVVQKQVSGQDIYTISKSAQYLTKILKEVVYSDVFFESILKSDYQIKESDFSDQSKERRKQLKKDIKVTIVRDLGIIEIDVFHFEKEKAEQISWAITSILEKDHGFYHGSGQNVEVKILDKPLVTENPVTLNIWISTVLGALLGLLISLIWIFRKKEASSLNGNVIPM